MKLSVVIPVYRVEVTLDRCVESVTSQSFADFELLLVDDGSPDRCPQMCDRWAERDSRIRVVHKANGGLSDARNAGIDRATGDYITFVDSDDFLAPNTLASLMDILAKRPEVDLLEYPVYVAYGSPRQHLLAFPQDLTYTDMEAYWLDGQAYQHTYAWNKIYRRELFEEVRFPKGVVFEDVNTLPRLLEKASVVATTNQGRYHYCANPQGITATADGAALRMLLAPHVDIIRRTQRRDRAFYEYYMHVVNIQMDVCEQAGDAPTLPFIHQDPSVLRGTIKLKAIALNILGINRLCKLNKLIHKLWRRGH